MPNQFFKNKSEIQAWLEEMCIYPFEINEDLTVKVNACVNLQNKGLKYLPVQFDEVIGDFFCAYNDLTTLKGCPQKVYGDFFCQGNDLINLIGGPKAILTGGQYNCMANELITLEGAPLESPNFYCAKNNITTLKGAPKKVFGSFDCSINHLVNLDYAPQLIEDDMDVSENNLVSLKSNNPITVSHLYIHTNPKLELDFDSCKNIKINGNLLIDDTMMSFINPNLKEKMIKSHDLYQDKKHFFNVNLKEQDSYEAWLNYLLTFKEKEQFESLLKQSNNHHKIKI